ncbi:MAG: 16S rRNA (uracil(1498)-N(3))-methyltransferase [Candidatus Omnitrophota bacterium]|nr:16S rRNA (uracil(1498)-N(3))-methyltransferase [Candidatus Omnitrophota bacterium]
MSRFYASPDSVSEGKIILRGREAHHARDVMRLRAGDEITVFDGTGKEYSGIIDKILKEQIIIKINKTFEKKADDRRLALVQAIPKLNKMDVIVEKATELGVERIIPVITARTIVQTDKSRAGLRAERWMKIAVMASKQCGRVTVPEINEIIRFEDSLSFVKGYELAVIPCLCEGTESIRTVLKESRARSAIAFIGPEGDFTEDEVKAARSKGVIPVSLGREVLRSDTAAISVLSVINYELRWGNGD